MKLFGASLKAWRGWLTGAALILALFLSDPEATAKGWVAAVRERVGWWMILPVLLLAVWCYALAAYQLWREAIAKIPRVRTVSADGILWGPPGRGGKTNTPYHAACSGEAGGPFPLQPLYPFDGENAVLICDHGSHGHVEVPMKKEYYWRLARDLDLTAGLAEHCGD